MNKIRKKNSRSTSATDAEKLSHLSFASLTFRFISSLVAQNTTSVLGRKNTNADSISFQPPNQIICKSVGVVFLCEVFRAHRRMFSGFPVSRFWFYKIYPLSPSFLPFRFIFTVKWYGMQQYPFSLYFEHCYSRKTTHFSGIVRPSQALIKSHNTRSSLRAIDVRVSRHKLHSTHSLSANSSAR